jgi:hypothetical protein
MTSTEFGVSSFGITGKARGDDLTVNTEGNSTLKSFCNWSKRLSTMLRHPSHNYTAVLVTKHDNCSGSDSYGSVAVVKISPVLTVRIQASLSLP